jgi:Ca2+-binding RTX toxin-like protein
VSSIVFRLSADVWNGAPLYQLVVDGLPLGAPVAVGAAHGAGEWQTTLAETAAAPQSVELRFINDAWGGTPAQDRNLYVDWLEVDGRRFEAEAAANDADLGRVDVDPGAAEMFVNGALAFDTAPPAGPDLLEIVASGDSWNGAPRFELRVDGASLGSFDVTAPHDGASFDTISVAGDFGPAPHTVEIEFLNDAWGGTPATDRNLYIDAIRFNGETYEGEAAGNDADLGRTGLDPDAAEMLVNGRLTFTGVGLAGETVLGTPDDDTLIGDEARNRIEALAGDDTLEGRGESDVLIGGTGRNLVDGGAGADIAVYSDSPEGVTASLGAPEGSARAGSVIDDRLVAIEAVRGSAFDDVITGDEGPNLLEGGAGGDRLIGGGGNDLLLSGQRGSGEVFVNALPFGGSFSGGELFPELRDGADFLDGGPGDDRLIGGAQTTYFVKAGNGSDEIFNFVPGGVVQLDGYAIGDTQTLFANVTPGFGESTIDLGNGETLTFAAGPHPGLLDVRSMGVTFVFTNVAGEGPTPTPDVPRAYVAPDGTGVAHGTAAAENIFATADGQTLIGGGGDDVFHVGTRAGLVIDASGPGISTVSTWSSQYALDAGVDNLRASGEYAHRLTGNAGDNVLTGAGRADRLDGAAGDDLLEGGGGADVFVYRTAGGIDEVGDFDRPGGDRIALDYGFQLVGRIDSFAELEQRVVDGLVTVTSGADWLRLDFAAPQPDALTIRGITDLRAEDWTFA